MGAGNIKFTFHYGPIQIKSPRLPSAGYTLFTFHYGPIQIFVRWSIRSVFIDLHSTMVLFK